MSVNLDAQIHIVKSFMDGLAQTTCQIYVNADRVSEYRFEADCGHCLAGKKNPLLDGELPSS